MKDKILNYLKTDRTFNSGLSLYMTYGNNIRFKTTLNHQGFSDYNHNLLLEELRKLADINEMQFNAIISLPVKQVKAVKPIVEVTSQEKQKFVNEIPESVKRTIRLREEFPFLSSPDCPNELKILVADMISSHARYVQNHKRLFDALSAEELSELSKSVVEDYLENRLIWEELDYFKKEGTPLKKHPIWAQQSRRQEISEMSTSDLSTLKTNLRSNISRNKGWLKKNPESEKAASWQKNFDDYSRELVMVEEILSKR